MAWRGLLSTGLHEVRIQFCQTSAESAAARNFVANHYLEMKKVNPKLPILIRESKNATPRVVARFDRGVERSVSLSGTSSDTEVAKKVADLLATSS